MQNVFISKQRPEDYLVSGNNTGEYPGAPSKCLFKDCGMPMPLKKHGFYTRYLLLSDFSGEIKIRRYICCICNRTVSMLPSFCLPQYTYGVELVVAIMTTAAETGSKRKTVKAHSGASKCLTRRHVAWYLSRLRQNRRLIEYGFNQLSPGSAYHNDSPGDTEWTREALLGKWPTLTAESNAEFHKTIGVSFMSTHNKVA